MKSPFDAMAARNIKIQMKLKNQNLYLISGTQTNKAGILSQGVFLFRFYPKL